MDLKMNIIKIYKYFLIFFILSFASCDNCNNMYVLLLEDDPILYALTDSGYLEIIPFFGQYTAMDNYDYYSNSAHIHLGPQTEARVSKIYLFQATDGLHLFFFHNCDECNYPNTVEWTIVTRDNNLEDDYVVKDDIASEDIYSVTAYPSEESKEYHISQTYNKNSDGGVIGPFENDNFSITIYIDDPGNIDSTVVESANGQTLEVSNEVTIGLQ